MKKDMIFFAFRYFVVPHEDQITMQQLRIENKNKLVIDFFKKIKEQKYTFSANNRKYIIYYSRKINKNIHLYKLARETLRTLHQDGDTDVQTSEELDYPYIYFIVDYQKQIILFQKKTTVFKKVSTVKNRIEELINEKINSFDYGIFLEEITDENAFWKYINQSSEIYELKLKLNSPNLFGGYIDAEMLLKKLNALFNNTSTDIKFKNEKGRLKVVKNNIEGFIKYITGGGGEWELNSVYKGKHQRISSKKNIKTIDLPDDINENDSSKGKVVEGIRELDHVMGESKGD
ncbi:hypothetical protein [Ornithinibacillus californiensis]|uniref:hypothetical protein n=1 Tax=Ornithinibacillus californiensis TaxID=161536 RepID=UPI00064D868B|nr:hypothetical protein [Ornithinibacillus californiensis]